ALMDSSLNLGGEHARLDCADHACGDLVLKIEDIVELSVVAISPEVAAAGGIDELASDANAVTALAHASFKDVAHAKPTRDVPDIEGLPTELEGGCARRDIEPTQARQPGDNLLDDTIGEVVLLWIAAHVLKRQDRD